MTLQNTSNRLQLKSVRHEVLCLELELMGIRKSRCMQNPNTLQFDVIVIHKVWRRDLLALTRDFHFISRTSSKWCWQQGIEVCATLVTSPRESLGGYKFISQCGGFWGQHFWGHHWSGDPDSGRALRKQVTTWWRMSCFGKLKGNISSHKMSQLLGYQFLWDGGTRLVLSPPAQACWATFIPWPKSTGVQLQGWQGSCLWSAKESFIKGCAFLSIISYLECWYFLKKNIVMLNFQCRACSLLNLISKN